MRRLEQQANRINRAELSTESVVIPVENVGEVEKIVTDITIKELVNNCTISK